MNVHSVVGELDSLIIGETTSDKVPPGHSYWVNAMYHDTESVRELATVDFQNGPIPVAGINGLTNEVLLTILIHRTTAINAQFPCEENQAAIYHMKEALDAFNQRTANRKARNVEGKMVK